MNFLILGWSSIARRRILLSLLNMPTVREIDIASRHGVERSELPEEWTGEIYTDYESALQQSKAEIVYVSLVNSQHGQWVQRALQSGHHVIADKPAFLDLPEAEAGIELSERKDLGLSEAVVFTHHAQVREVDRMFEEGRDKPRRIQANFSFPPFEPSNFRNFSQHGGGALLDLGPYTAATCRYFLGDSPTVVQGTTLGEHPETGVDIAFSAMVTYAGGRSFVGHFGFDTEYRNGIRIIGERTAVEIDGFYTLPPDMNNTLSVWRENVATTLTISPSDMFQNYIEWVLEAISLRQLKEMRRDLYTDATFRHRLSAAVRQGQ